jgi:hypothetical protein
VTATLYKHLMIAITAFGLLGCVTFVVAYAVRSGGTWIHQEAGRFLMVVYTSLAMLLALVLSNQIFADWPGRRQITVALFVLYCIKAWWPLRLLTRAQEDARRRRAADDHAQPPRDPPTVADIEGGAPMVDSIPVPPSREADARNRALRTFLQGLGVDIVVALALTVGPALVGSEFTWSRAYWQTLGLIAAKTVITTIVSYVTRKLITFEPDRAVRPAKPDRSRPTRPPSHPANRRHTAGAAPAARSGPYRRHRPTPWGSGRSVCTGRYVPLVPLQRYGGGRWWLGGRVGLDRFGFGRADGPVRFDVGGDQLTGHVRHNRRDHGLGGDQAEGLPVGAGPGELRPDERRADGQGQGHHDVDAESLQERTQRPVTGVGFPGGWYGDAVDHRCASFDVGHGRRVSGRLGVVVGGAAAAGVFLSAGE